MSRRSHESRNRVLSVLAALSVLFSLMLFAGQLVAFADPPNGTGHPKITICHRTNAASNPYVQITVAVAAADGVAGNSGGVADHFGEHQGPIFDPAIHGNGDDWGDIIPNVDDDGNPMPHSGLNWTTQGQSIWRAGCAFAPPTSPPPTSPPPTTPPPTTPPPTTPPPTTPPPAISVLIQKTNDANEDGVFSNNEEAESSGSDVDFELVITNTSGVTVELVELTDAFDQTTLDMLAAKCASLAGVTLDPNESVTCTFTLNVYSPAQGRALVNIAKVCVEIVGGTRTGCDTNPSRVHTARVLGRTVTPTNPPPTRTPPGGIAFTGPRDAIVWFALVSISLLLLGMGALYAGYRRGARGAR